MQPNANAEGNRAPEVTPTIKHTVPWRVTVTALPDARLRVIFVDGTVGEVHMKSFLSSPHVEGTVFEQLRDPAIFAQAQVELGQFSGRMAPISRRTRCMTRSVSVVDGFSTDCVLVNKDEQVAFMKYFDYRSVARTAKIPEEKLRKLVKLAGGSFRTTR